MTTLFYFTFCIFVPARAIKPAIKYTNMKSRITIEVDFERNNQPVIKVLFKKSDDVRDNLLQSFLQKLGSESNWCRIDVSHYIDDPTQPDRNFTCWQISPITPDQLVDQSKHMQERLISNNS